VGCSPARPISKDQRQIRYQNDHNATYQSVQEHCPGFRATSVDNWDELIEAPSVGIIAVRAHKNWLARLAATELCVKHDFAPIILPEEPYWLCCSVSTVREDGSVERIALIC
jgi:hypothetical protein